MNLLLPNKTYNSIFDIPLVQLYTNGIRGIIFDLDNTLTEWNNPELSGETISWLENAKKIGFKMCFVSNNSDLRVKEIADLVDIPFVAWAKKPRRRSFRKAMDLMDTKPEHTAVVGDQIFTDILGGNRLGLFTVLVSPISKKEFVGTRLVRLIEKIILERNKRRVGLK
ncbi:MAG: YqeG family HAD IIIA-type phosphatase [Thermacetogeniaceae bacterium]|jgi:HAD superfamily phosphatase (TIGR01668 family)|nr:YqeG family HAD IIIA-type phosphatase [Thermoanaerobacterales bacterium]NLN20559.1 YqeG family HAD IIIA-type phosphatase [Syntrophomonadaceae bacterium]HAF17221.1 YqeG family HAD IIIA-type phosphatase [Peptococcaceae bacterium]